MVRQYFRRANPPKLNNDFVNLFVRLPDGRVWFDSLEFSVAGKPGLLKDIWYYLIHPGPAKSRRAAAVHCRLKLDIRDGVSR